MVIQLPPAACIYHFSYFGMLPICDVRRYCSHGVEAVDVLASEII